MSTMTAVASIITPSEEDVIFEKGLKAQCHPGNVYYRQIIKEKVHEYNTTETRKIKDVIAMSIFQRINNTRRRFLAKLEDGKYSVLSEEAVIVKIKQALRDQNRGRLTTIERRRPEGGPEKKKGQRKTKASPVLNPIPVKRDRTIHVDKDMVLKR